MDEPTHDEALSGTLIDDETLTVAELAQACAIGSNWVTLRVEAGLLGCCSEAQERRFASRDLQRARRLLGFERDFEANPELAAIVVDLLDEVQQLRARLRAISGPA